LYLSQAFLNEMEAVSDSDDENDDFNAGMLHILWPLIRLVSDLHMHDIFTEPFQGQTFDGSAQDPMPVMDGERPFTFFLTTSQFQRTASSNQSLCCHVESAERRAAYWMMTTTKIWEWIQNVRFGWLCRHRCFRWRHRTAISFEWNP